MDLLRPYQVDRSHLTLNGKGSGGCLQFPLSNEQWPRAPASKCWWHELLLSRSVKKKGLIADWVKAKALAWTLKQVQCFVSSFKSIGQILIHQLQCSDFVCWRLCGAMLRPAQTPERNLECAVGACITGQMASFQVAIIAALGEMRLQLVCKL